MRRRRHTALAFCCVWRHFAATMAARRLPCGDAYHKNPENRYVYAGTGLAATSRGAKEMVVKCTSMQVRELPTAMRAW